MRLSNDVIVLDVSDIVDSDSDSDRASYAVWMFPLMRLRVCRCLIGCPIRYFEGHRRKDETSSGCETKGGVDVPRFIRSC